MCRISHALCSKFYISYFKSHFAEITARFLNGSIQNKSQFYSDSFYRTALYFKTISGQKLLVTSLVFVIWQTVSKISIFYCRLVFQEFHSRVQMHIYIYVVSNEYFKLGTTQQKNLTDLWHCSCLAKFRPNALFHVFRMCIACLCCLTVSKRRLFI